MELALSLGDASKPFPDFLEKSQKGIVNDLGFFMGLGPARTRTCRQRPEEESEPEMASSDPPVAQLDLLPFSPVPRSQRQIPPSVSSTIRLPWVAENILNVEPDSPDTVPVICGVDVNRPPTTSDDAALSSSPTSAISSFPMDFSLVCGERRKRELLEIGGGSDYNDDDENGLTRKKLRLSKEQSAFLEDSFKEHHTLNPKQKQALAKQLNLRARQVEVWFQNRRARTKLKQTEVDCEYLKRCCETLTEDNRRLHKEVQELRALKVPPQPRYIPATTLTMCPSCERVATSTASSNNNKPKLLHPFCGDSQKKN